ncbi:MAG TPA: SIMPL domain-containing protein [Chryseolinea sp.]|nr:SIMPL domain-containing protein [Chryseolinea sp.]
MKKGLLVLSLALSTLLAIAQNDKRYIEVIGSAESEINPNIIVLSIRLKEYEENKTKITLDKIEKDFLEAVNKSKIEKQNIALADLTANAISQKRRDRETYSQKTYEITFSKTDEVLLLLENLKNVKIDFLDIVKLSHTEIEKYRLEIKIQALKAAEAKADALLHAVNVKRGKPLLIQENPSYENFNQSLVLSNRSYYANADMDIEYSGTSEIALKKIKLRFEILARFEIE